MILEVRTKKRKKHAGSSKNGRSYQGGRGRQDTLTVKGKGSVEEDGG